MIDLYVDGGVIETNPSMIGGTWAFILVENNSRIIYRAKGVVTPGQMQKGNNVTNNQMELYAALKGIEYITKRKIEVKTLYSDSQVTLGRLFRGWELRNIPAWMIRWMNALSLNGIRGEFVRAHNGNRWNELADKLAVQAGFEFLR